MFSKKISRDMDTRIEKIDLRNNEVVFLYNGDRGTGRIFSYSPLLFETEIEGRILIVEGPSMFSVDLCK